MIAFKTELDANDKQTTALLQHVGAARWAYNWGLDQVKQAAEAGERWPSAIDLHKRLNAIKGTDELPWGYEVSKCAMQESLRNLDVAIKNWSASRKGERNGPKMAFPHYKSRKNGLGTCRFTGTIKIFDGHIQLPRIGLLRLKEHGYLPVGAKVSQATISEQAGHWFVSVTVDGDRKRQVETTGEVLGIDVGIKTLATCSDGDTFANPKALSAKTKQLRRWQRKLARRVKGSKNRAKAKMQVAKLHKKVADVRRDAHNKAARAIVDKRPSVIVIEDLNVKGMVKNRRLARSLSDAALGNLGRTISYMALDDGIEVRKAGRFFASSRLCSDCGWKNEALTLSDRTFVCLGCGMVKDRDLNAAVNLKNTGSSSEIQACGDHIRPTPLAMVVEAGTLSQMSAVEIFV